MKYIDTTANKKLFAMRGKIRNVGGGTGASKTVGIIIWLIDYAQSVKNEIIDVVAESYPHLEQGAIREFKNIMSSCGYWHDSQWNDTKHIYTFGTNTELHFQSYDKLGKAHGPRRDVLFLNEGNWLSWDVVEQLILRTRKVVWVDYNPVSEFWMHTEVLGKRNDVESLKLTFEDNEGLSEKERKEIESKKVNSRFWKVYGLGELGEPIGRIYTNWQFIDEVPLEARLERYGLDFGYDPDPTALIAVYYYNGSYILDEIIYTSRIDNPAIASTIKNLPPALVIADSAEPKSISEIKNFGINIIGTQKGKDSVRYGVKTVQTQKISVTTRSLNLIKEYRNFFQAIDHKTNIPIMGEYEGIRHALDAIRYAICSMISIKQRKEMLIQMPHLPRMKQTNPAF